MYFYMVLMYSLHYLPVKYRLIVYLVYSLTFWLKQNSVCAYWLFQVEIPINIGYQPYRQIRPFRSYVCPLRKPISRGPEGPRNSGNPQAMAIRDADDGQTEIDVPSHTTS